MAGKMPAGWSKDGEQFRPDLRVGKLLVDGSAVREATWWLISIIAWYRCRYDNLDVRSRDQAPALRAQ